MSDCGGLPDIEPIPDNGCVFPDWFPDYQP